MWAELAEEQSHILTGRLRVHGHALPIQGNRSGLYNVPVRRSMELYEGWDFPSLDTKTLTRKWGV